MQTGRFVSLLCAEVERGSLSATEIKSVKLFGEGMAWVRTPAGSVLAYAAEWWQDRGSCAGSVIGHNPRLRVLANPHAVLGVPDVGLDADLGQVFESLRDRLPQPVPGTPGGWYDHVVPLDIPAAFAEWGCGHMVCDLHWVLGGEAVVSATLVIFNKVQSLNFKLQSWKLDNKKVLGRPQHRGKCCGHLKTGSYVSILEN